MGIKCCVMLRLFYILIIYIYIYCILHYTKYMIQSILYYNMPTKYPLLSISLPQLSSYKYQYQHQQDDDTSICGNNNNPVNKWCTFQVLDYGTMIVQSVYLCCLVLLLGLMVKRFWKIIRNRYELADNDQDKQLVYGNLFVRIYLIMFAWLTASIIRVSLCLFVYHNYMAQDFQSQYKQLTQQYMNVKLNEQDELDISDMIVILSNVYTFLNFLCVFLVNWLIIIISHSWLYIVLQSTKQSQQSLSISRRKTLHIFFKILRIMQIYYRYIRTCFLLLLLIQPLLFYMKIGHCQYSDINCHFVIGQCSIVIAFYGFGLVVFYFMIGNKLMNVRDTDMQRLRIQYFALMLTLICRLVYNLFPITNNPNYHPNSNCSNTDSRQSLQLTLILSIHHIFMHLLPIIIVLYIYRINFTVGTGVQDGLTTMIQSDRLQDSLIIVSDNNTNHNSSNNGNHNKVDYWYNYDKLLSSTFRQSQQQSTIKQIKQNKSKLTSQPVQRS